MQHKHVCIAHESTCMPDGKGLVSLMNGTILNTVQVFWKTVDLSMHYIGHIGGVNEGSEV